MLQKYKRGCLKSLFLVKLNLFQLLIIIDFQHFEILKQACLTVGRFRMTGFLLFRRPRDYKKNLEVISLQSHQIECAHLQFQNLHPFFEPLGSLMEVHRNRVRYLLETRDDLNNYRSHSCG